jgi:hypothetical protein
MSKTIEISDETYEKIKDQLTHDDFEVNSLEDLNNKKFFIRTVTYHLVGEVKGRVGNFISLKGASWVADSGRFMGAIKNGTLSEVEPVGDAWVNLNSIVDMFPWKHKLPTEQK